MQPTLELGDLDETAAQDGFAVVGRAHRAGEGLAGFLAGEDAERRARAGEFGFFLLKPLQRRLKRLAAERSVSLVAQVFDGGDR